ncbi:MAG: hypothetical protein FP826_02715 [Sphingomonadales bacterium]|nr:hypothetical protein [Sphingomonadales bacterium]MBU3993591.1 hypothetical protein [Alphaproteobacteria bacterium]
MIDIERILCIREFRADANIGQMKHKRQMATHSGRHLHASMVSRSSGQIPEGLAGWINPEAAPG